VQSETSILLKHLEYEFEDLEKDVGDNMTGESLIVGST